MDHLTVVVEGEASATSRPAAQHQVLYRHQRRREDRRGRGSIGKAKRVIDRRPNGGPWWKLSWRPDDGRVRVRLAITQTATIIAAPRPMRAKAARRGAAGPQLANITARQSAPIDPMKTFSAHGVHRHFHRPSCTARMTGRRGGVHFELAIQVLDVRDHSVRGDAELRCDLLVAAAAAEHAPRKLPRVSVVMGLNARMSHFFFPIHDDREVGFFVVEEADVRASPRGARQARRSWSHRRHALLPSVTSTRASVTARIAAIAFVFISSLQIRSLMVLIGTVRSVYRSPTHAHIG